MEKVIYRHMCDSCGKLFEDSRTSMDHCMDMNGMVLCEECES